MKSEKCLIATVEIIFHENVCNYLAGDVVEFEFYSIPSHTHFIDLQDIFASIAVEVAKSSPLERATN